MKKIIPQLLFALVAVTVFLAPFSAGAAQYEKITVTVKGMVCSFCAQGIKKTFGKIREVRAVEVDLDKKFVKLELKDGAALSDEVIRKNITDAGYDVEKIERTQG